MHNSRSKSPSPGCFGFCFGKQPKPAHDVVSLAASKYLSQLQIGADGQHQAPNDRTSAPLLATQRISHETGSADRNLAAISARSSPGRVHGGVSLNGTHASPSTHPAAPSRQAERLVGGATLVDAALFMAEVREMQEQQRQQQLQQQQQQNQGQGAVPGSSQGPPSQRNVAGEGGARGGALAAAVAAAASGSAGPLQQRPSSSISLSTGAPASQASLASARVRNQRLQSEEAEKFAQDEAKAGAAWLVGAGRAKGAREGGSVHGGTAALRDASPSGSSIASPAASITSRRSAPKRRSTLGAGFIAAVSAATGIGGAGASAAVTPAPPKPKPNSDQLMAAASNRNSTVSLEAYAGAQVPPGKGAKVLPGAGAGAVTSSSSSTAVPLRRTSETTAAQSERASDPRKSQAARRSMPGAVVAGAMPVRDGLQQAQVSQPASPGRGGAGAGGQVEADRPSADRSSAASSRDAQATSFAVWRVPTAVRAAAEPSSGQVPSSSARPPSWDPPSTGGGSSTPPTVPSLSSAQVASPGASSALGRRPGIWGPGGGAAAAGGSSGQASPAYRSMSARYADYPEETDRDRDSEGERGGRFSRPSAGRGRDSSRESSTRGGALKALRRASQVAHALMFKGGLAWGSSSSLATAGGAVGQGAEDDASSQVGSEDRHTVSASLTPRVGLGGESGLGHSASVSMHGGVGLSTLTQQQRGIHISAMSQSAAQRQNVTLKRLASRKSHTVYSHGDVQVLGLPIDLLAANRAQRNQREGGLARTSATPGAQAGTLPLEPEDLTSFDPSSALGKAGRSSGSGNALVPGQAMIGSTPSNSQLTSGPSGTTSPDTRDLVPATALSRSSGIMGSQPISLGSNPLQQQVAAAARHRVSESSSSSASAQQRGMMPVPFMGARVLHHQGSNIEMGSGVRLVAPGVLSRSIGPVREGLAAGGSGDYTLQTAADNALAAVDGAGGAAEGEGESDRGSAGPRSSRLSFAAMARQQREPSGAAHSQQLLMSGMGVGTAMQGLGRTQSGASNDMDWIAGSMAEAEAALTAVCLAKAAGVAGRPSGNGSRSWAPQRSVGLEGERGAWGVPAGGGGAGGPAGEPYRGLSSDHATVLGNSGGLMRMEGGPETGVQVGPASAAGGYTQGLAAGSARTSGSGVPGLASGPLSGPGAGGLLQSAISAVGGGGAGAQRRLHASHASGGLSLRESIGLSIAEEEEEGGERAGTPQGSTHGDVSAGVLGHRLMKTGSGRSHHNQQMSRLGHAAMAGPQPEHAMAVLKSLPQALKPVALPDSHAEGPEGHHGVGGTSPPAAGLLSSPGGGSLPLPAPSMAAMQASQAYPSSYHDLGLHHMPHVGTGKGLVEVGSPHDFGSDFEEDDPDAHMGGDDEEEEEVTFRYDMSMSNRAVSLRRIPSNRRTSKPGTHHGPPSAGGTQSHGQLMQAPTRAHNNNNHARVSSSGQHDGLVRSVGRRRSVGTVAGVVQAAEIILPVSRHARASEAGPPPAR